MRLTLQPKLSQQLKLSPQVQQSVRLLQLSTVELNREIERVVQENPLLEQKDREEETNQSNVVDWFQEKNVFRGVRDNNDDKGEWSQLEGAPLSLREHLNFQVSLSKIAVRKRKIVELLIDSLDEDGYLMQDLNELMALLPPTLEIDREELEIALEYLQQMDPLGVGARDLKECLSIQLKALPEDTLYLDEALLLVNENLESLAQRDFRKLKKQMDCSDDCLRSVQSLIVHLSPKPGAVYSPPSALYVIPDVLVTKVNGVWVANLNSSVKPNLNIDSDYAKIIKDKKQGAAGELANQLKEANWFVNSINQHFNTILEVSRIIVDRQQQFFEHGAIAMRPLLIREIASLLKLNESTVSRVTTQKFMHTPFGILEFKYFFGSHVATDTGGACSATAIRALIKQLIQAENIKKPLSDSRISEILEKQGIVVARRTIAKYRESINIPPVNLRKSI